MKMLWVWFCYVFGFGDFVVFFVWCFFVGLFVFCGEVFWFCLWFFCLLFIFVFVGVYLFVLIYRKIP